MSDLGYVLSMKTIYNPYIPYYREQFIKKQKSKERSLSVSDLLVMARPERVTSGTLFQSNGLAGGRRICPKFQSKTDQMYRK